MEKLCKLNTNVYYCILTFLSALWAGDGQDNELKQIKIGADPWAWSAIQAISLVKCLHCDKQYKIVMVGVKKW